MTPPLAPQLRTEDDTSPVVVPLRPEERAVSTSLAQMLLAILQTSVETLNETSEEVCAKTGSLSDLFTDLIDTADVQETTLQRLLVDISQIEHEGETLDLTRLPQELHDTLEKTTKHIVEMSKQGVELIYALDEILGILNGMHQSITEIEAINRQSKLLAINAEIEAVQPGVQSAGFGVVSTEMRHLADRIDHLSRDMRQQADSVAGRVRTVIEKMRADYETLNEAGAMDLQDHVRDSERLEQLMKSLVTRNSTIETELLQSSKRSKEIAFDIQRIVVSMQFQDMMSQRVEALVGVFDTVIAAFDEYGDLTTMEDHCDQLSERIFTSISLSEVRSKFELALTGKSSARTSTIAFDDTDSSDSIELF